MRVDASASAYQEISNAMEEFDLEELRFCRFLLRRLHFLEAKINEPDSKSYNSGGAVLAELEMQSLAWVLTEIEFLEER